MDQLRQQQQRQHHREQLKRPAQTEHWWLTTLRHQFPLLHQQQPLPPLPPLPSLPTQQLTVDWTSRPRAQASACWR